MSTKEGFHTLIPVSEENLLSAAQIHAASWQASHRSFCSEAFVRQHSVSHQKAYLQNEIRAGKRLYMQEAPVGIVSVKGSLIENLYVLPSEQCKGCGTQLLLFALSKWEGTPCLWVLSSNERAQAFYRKHGFHLTGNAHSLSETLSEWEMRR